MVYARLLASAQQLEKESALAFDRQEKQDATVEAKQNLQIQKAILTRKNAVTDAETTVKLAGNCLKQSIEAKAKARAAEEMAQHEVDVKMSTQVEALATDNEERQEEAMKEKQRSRQQSIAAAAKAEDAGENVKVAERVVVQARELA